MSGQGNVNFGPAFELEKDIERDHRRARRIEHALQAVIGVLSVIAMYLIVTPGPLEKWGYVVGLASQPFWFAATWRAGQIGMFIVAIFYTGAWVQGIAVRFF